LPADDVLARDFDAHRGYLFAVAYRMLGSTADAEDIIQEAFLRWMATARDRVESPRAFLTTVVVRLCIDERKSARARRESYVGPWLPEPLIVDDRDGAQAVELADSLSLAFLVMLEELTAVERAAFLLHEVFGYGYPEIAAMIDRQEPACRQLVSRARSRVGDRQHRFDADRQRGRELADEFLAACAGGDLTQLVGLFSDDVVVWTDGGGMVRAARNPIYGPEKSARFLAAVTATVPGDAVVAHALINAQPGVVISVSGVVTVVVALDIIDGHIAGVRVVSNPEKLKGLSAALGR
jgi:RNA polymerase sigma-70 factor, ECF subfamily